MVKFIIYVTEKILYNTCKIDTDHYKTRITMKSVARRKSMAKGIRSIKRGMAILLSACMVFGMTPI